jgi:LuxR family transcriptional regulator, maltose regulon positive regulatory protein
VPRYLPTNLSGPEIARELSVSPNTVKTHIRHSRPATSTGRRWRPIGPGGASTP